MRIDKSYLDQLVIVYSIRGKTRKNVLEFLDKGRVQKKKLGIFLKGGWVPSNFGSVSQLFLFVFNHGLNHPEMQEKKFQPLVTPPIF